MIHNNLIVRYKMLLYRYSYRYRRSVALKRLKDPLQTIRESQCLRIAAPLRSLTMLTKMNRVAGRSS